MHTKKMGDQHQGTKHEHVEHEIEASAGGAIAGGAIGAFAGPPGVVVGAILGAAAGALADYSVEHDAVSRAEDDEALEREPDVEDIEPNVPNPVHLTAKPAGGSAAACEDGNGAPSKDRSRRGARKG
jgi:phage tail tape-measure protein